MTDIHALLQYTTILHPIRKRLGLTNNEYAVFDSIYHLSKHPKRPHCDKTQQQIAEFLGLSRRQVIRICQKGVDLDLIEKVRVGRREKFRTTEQWYSTVVVVRSGLSTGDRMSPKTPPAKSDEMSPQASDILSPATRDSDTMSPSKVTNRHPESDKASLAYRGNNNPNEIDKQQPAVSLLKLSFSDTEMQKLLKQHTAERIEEVVDGYYRASQTKTIANPKGWLIQALNEDWDVSTPEERHREKQQRQRNQEEEQSQRQAAEEATAQRRKQEVSDWIEAQPETFLAMLEKEQAKLTGNNAPKIPSPATNYPKLSTGQHPDRRAVDSARLRVREILDQDKHGVSQEAGPLESWTVTSIPTERLVT